MTRGDALDRVLELMGDTSPETRTLMEPWVNFVLAEIALAGVLTPDAEWTKSTVAGQRAYALPSDIAELYSIRFPANDRVLHITAQAEFDRIRAVDEAREGAAEAMTVARLPTSRERGEVLLYPVPDEAETMVLRGLANFRTLTDDADLLELHDHHFPALVYGLYRIGARFDSIRDVPDAAAAFEKAIGDIKFHQYGGVARTYATQFNDEP